MNTKEKIEVMQAWLDGKKVRFFERSLPGKWHTLELCNVDPCWDWKQNIYAIVREPVERWAVEYKENALQMYRDEAVAKECCKLYNGLRIFLMREVLE